MSEKKTDMQKKQHRRGRSMQIGRLLPEEVSKSFRKYGFMEKEVVTRWHEIVGADLARHCLPERLKFQRGKKQEGTLHLLAESAFATHLHHLSPVLCERINSFFGYKAVGNIAIRQGPLPAVQSEKESSYSLTADKKAVLDKLVDSASDKRLKQSLKKLGAAVLSESNKVQGKE